MPSEGTPELSGGSRHKGRATVPVSRWILPDPAMTGHNSERGALEKVGLDAAQYTGHSFSIGAATVAAKAGMEDSVIKTLGRWRSLAYLEYVRIPREQLASYSIMLCA